METKARPKPGLKSIHEGREARKTGRYSRPSGGVWLLAASAIGASLIAYKVISGHQLDVAKSDLLSKQRAATTTLGKEWFPLRDKLESYVLEQAKGFPGEFVDSEA